MSESIFLIADDGAVRFFDEQTYEFVAKNSEIPLFVHISELLEDAHLVSNNIISQVLHGKLEGSLGGVRLKAILMNNNQLKIAKFPSENDENDVEAWVGGYTFKSF